MRHRFEWTAATLFALMIPALVPSCAHAQLGTSTWSLEIGTDVGTFDDLAIGVRRHSGAGSAFRFLIEANANKTDGKGQFFDTGSVEDAAQKTDTHSLGLAIHWMRFAQVHDNLSAVLAIGPSVRSLRSTLRSGTGPGTPTFSEFEGKTSELTFGLEVLLGAEWFFTSRFSLGGSAGFRGEIGNGDQVQIGRSGTGPTYEVNEMRLETDIARVSTRSGRIQLCAYF